MIEDRKPKFFYGYIVVLAVCLIMILTWGTLYSFGVFFKPLLNELGWSRAMTSTAFSLSMLGYGVLSIVTGKMNDKYGPRIVISICGLLLGLGYLMMSQVNAIWQFYVLYGVLIGIGMSGFYVPLLSTVARWFERRRGMMTGISISGVGIGTIIIPLMTGWFISGYGWRTSYIIIGTIILVSIIGITQFLSRDPSKRRLLSLRRETVGVKSQVLEVERFSFRQALHTRQFWLLCSMLFSFGLILQLITVHIVPHATDLGISDTRAISILAIIGGTSIAGRITMGSISDRIGNKSALNISFMLLSVSLFWLLFSKELWMFYVFAVVFGLGYGGFAPLSSLMVAQIFGLDSHGTILGGTEIMFTIGSAIGPALAGSIFDVTGDYQLAFLACGLLSVVLLVLVSLLRPVTNLGKGSSVDNPSAGLNSSPNGLPL
ncbi:MFS transporter [Chloroflexota bacterium]